MRRAEELRRQGRFLELDQLQSLKYEADLQKWKDTGYEDEIVRVYQNPLERKAQVRKEKQDIDLGALPYHKLGKNIKDSISKIKESETHYKRESKR